MCTKGLWQGHHPNLWGATEFQLGDILVLDLAFLLDKRDGRMFDPWEYLCGYKQSSIHVVVANVVILEDSYSDFVKFPTLGDLTKTNCIYFDRNRENYITLIYSCPTGVSTLHPLFGGGD